MNYFTIQILQSKITKQQQFLQVYRNSQALLIRIKDATPLEEIKEFFAQRNTS